jgi:hypothetical protein
VCTGLDALRAEGPVSIVSLVAREAPEDSGGAVFAEVMTIVSMSAASVEIAAVVV